MKSLMIFSAALAATALPLSAAAEPVSDRFSVEVVGEGPDVILIPGLSSPRSVWDDTVALLDDRYRLHLVEVGGFGTTPVGANGEGEILPGLITDLAAYIDEAGLETPTIVGHSMGGFTGLSLSLDHPDKVGKLVIVDSLPFFSVIFNPAATVENVTPQAKGMRDMMIASADVDMPAPACDAPSPNAQGMSKSPEGQCKVDRYTMDADRKVMAQAMYEIMTTDLRGRVGELSVPTLMLFPYDPPMLSLEMAERVYGTAYGEVDTVTLKGVENSRHFIMFDQPEVFHDALTAFLAD